MRERIVERGVEGMAEQHAGMRAEIASEIGADPDSATVTRLVAMMSGTGGAPQTNGVAAAPTQEAQVEPYRTNPEAAQAVLQNQQGFDALIAFWQDGTVIPQEHNDWIAQLYQDFGHYMPTGEKMHPDFFLRHGLRDMIQ